MTNCPKCKAEPSSFTLVLSTFWKDVDVICKCGYLIENIYCSHCLEGGKKRYQEYRPICKNQIENFLGYMAGSSR